MVSANQLPQFVVDRWDRLATVGGYGTLEAVCHLLEQLNDIVATTGHVTHLPAVVRLYE